MWNRTGSWKRVEGDVLRVCILMIAFALLLPLTLPAQEEQPAAVEEMQAETPQPQTQAQPEQAAAPSAEFNAAMKLYRQRRFTDAIAAFQNIVAADPGNAAAWYFMGYAHYVQRHLPEAQEAFGKAFAADPRFDPRPHFRAH